MAPRAPASVRHRLVTPAAWLDALGDPRCAVQFPRGGTATVAPGWGTPRRTMVEHLFYLVTAHAFEVTLSSGPLRIAAGDFLWVRPGEPHALALPQDVPAMSMHWLRMRVAASSGRAELTPGSGVVVVRDAWRVRPAFEALSAELQGGLAFRDRRLRALASLVASEALRAGDDGGAAGPQLTTAQRERLRALVAAHPERRMTPATLARELGLTHDYFARIFRRSLGVTPRRWLMEERIRHAARRLAGTALAVSQVAEAFGYHDVYLFSRQFRDVMGRSPSAWRREAQP